MAEEGLDGSNIGLILEQVSRELVAKGVSGDAHGQVGSGGGAIAAMLRSPIAARIGVLRSDPVVRCRLSPGWTQCGGI